MNGQKLTKEDLANPETYFLEEEKADLEKNLDGVEEGDKKYLKFFVNYWKIMNFRFIA